MKRTNKVLSVILAAVMVIGVIPVAKTIGFDMSEMFTAASAAEPHDIGIIDTYVENAFSDIDNYLSIYDNLADSFDYYRYVGSIITSSTAIDLINSGNAMYTLAETYVSDISNNVEFMTALAAWKFAGYIVDPVDAWYDGTGITSQAYYESILLKCLECEIKSDNLIDALNKDCMKNTTSILKLFNSTFSVFLTETYKGTKEYLISNLTDDDYNNLCKEAEDWVEENANGILGTVLTKDVSYMSDLLTMSSNVEKFAEKLASLAALSNLSDSVGNYLKRLSQTAGDNKLGKACDEIADIILDSVDSTITIALFDGVSSVGKQFFTKYISDTLWKNGVLATLSRGALSTGASLTNGVLLGIKIGRAIGDICFSTSKIEDKYEMLHCYWDILNMQRNVVVSLIDSYSGSTEEAIMLSDSVDLLYNTYSVGSDLILSAIDVFNNSLIHFSSEEDYQAARAAVTVEKNYYKNQYNQITSSYRIAAVNNAVSWLITNDGSLLLVGSGSIDSAPWSSRANEIKHIYVSSNITALGDNLFVNTAATDEIIVLESVSSFSGTAFSGMDSSCSIVFNSEVTCTSALTGDYPIYAEKKITLGDTDVKNIYTKAYLYAGSLKVRDEAIIGGTAEFSQWGTVTIPTGAQLICNMFVGRSWAYVAGSYNTAVNNNGTIIACTKAYGYIDYNGSDSANFITSRLVGNQLRMYGGTVTVAGETNLISSENTRVILNGKSGTTYSVSGTVKSLDVYTDGATLENAVTIKDYVDFHGCDVEVLNYIQLEVSATPRSGSNYKSLRFANNYTITCNISADSMFIPLDNVVNIKNGHFTLTGDVSGDRFNFKVSSGADLTVDGSLQSNKVAWWYSEINNEGTLRVTGTVSGCIDFYKKTGKYYFNNINLTENTTEGGSYYIAGNVIKMTISDNSSYDFCGTEAQTVTLNGNLGRCEINNTKGVTFVNKVNSTVLFNHNLNPFTLQNGGSFVDYDKDGLKDNVDPLPLVAQTFDTDLLNDLSVKVKLHSGSSFDQYYWEVTEIPSGNVDVEIPSAVGDIPVRIVDDIFSNCENLHSVTLYPGLYDVSQLSIEDDSVIIRGYTGTPAQAYADSTGHQFESIGNITSININQNANSKDFTINDDFSADGLLINVFTDDGKAYITNSFETEGFDNCPGIKTITVSYADAEVTYQVVVSEYSYSYINNQDITINNYYGTDINLVIPDNIYGRNVKSISSLGTIDGVKTVCLPAGLISISSTVFNSATELNAIDVDAANSVFTSKDGILVSASGKKIIRCPIAFENKDILLDDAVTEIGSYAFANCGLSSVLLPDSLETIGSYAFMGNDFASLSIPESVTTIERNSFENCQHLTSVNYNAVHAETGISGSGWLATLTIPLSAVFRYDSNIETVNIGPNVKYIPTGLMVGMNGLKTINIEENSELNSIAQYAFVNDNALTDIYYNGYYKDWKQISIENNNTPLTNATLHCVECDECTWNEGVVTSEATCVAEGRKLYTCEVCGKERTESISINPNNHVAETAVINEKAATYYENGYSGDTICSDCRTVLVNGTQIAKLTPTLAGTYSWKGHTYALYSATVDWNYAKAYAEDTGGHLLTITSAAEQAVIENWLSAYDYDSIWLGAADEEEEGEWKWVTDEPFEYSNWSAGEPNNAGGDEDYAEFSGGQWNDIPASKYTVYAFIVENDPSCFSGDTVNHTWNEGVVTLAPTCLTAGEVVYTCEICEETKTECMNPLGHDYGVWTNLNGNQHQRVCLNDPSHVEKENHSWNNGTVTKAATCTDAGTRTYTCTVCGAKKTETINATGHNYGAWTLVKAPTCTEDGVEQRVCANDGKHVEKRSVTKLAHDDRDGDGYCDNCHADLGTGGETHESNCVCGQYHTGPLAGIIKFFHKIVYFFKNLFGKN